MSAIGIYPLSTQDGKAIPLDVVKGNSLVPFSFATAANTAIVIPAGFTLCYAYATEDCILRLDSTALPNPLVDGTAYANTLLIPKKRMMVIVVVAGAANIVGMGTAGKLYLVSIEQWAALVQAQQSNIG